MESLIVKITVVKYVYCIETFNLYDCSLIVETKKFVIIQHVLCLANSYKVKTDQTKLKVNL